MIKQTRKFSKTIKLKSRTQWVIVVSMKFVYNRVKLKQYDDRVLNVTITTTSRKLVYNSTRIAKKINQKNS